MQAELIKEKHEKVCALQSESWIENLPNSWKIKLKLDWSIVRLS